MGEKGLDGERKTGVIVQVGKIIVGISGFADGDCE